MGRSHRFDAFISYSHHADGELAPALQAGLQRLAKPWGRRRALEVFRDDTGLTVSPHLWGAIVEALDASAWFVLLASPTAAASEWVNREISHWLTKDPTGQRILPVLTAGSWEWDDDRAGFTPGSDAVPAALAGVFTAEPRHLDISWAHDDVDLDVRNPRFREALADLAAPMHGKSKDDLISDDIVQHRRAVRIRRSAVAALAILAAGALTASVLAVRSADEARAQRRTAEAERERAETNADEADAQRRNAESERDRAETNAALSRSRELAALAEQAVVDDPALAMLLAVEAHHPVDESLDFVTDEADRALRRALTSYLTAPILDVGGFDGPVSASAMAISPDGATVATSGSLAGATLQVDLWDSTTGRPAGEPLANPISPTYTLAYSPDGRWLLATGLSSPVVWDLEDALEDSSTPTERSPVELSAAWGHAVFAADGTIVALGARAPDPAGGVPDLSSEVVVYDPERLADGPVQRWSHELPVSGDETPASWLTRVASLPSGAAVVVSGREWSESPGPDRLSIWTADGAVPVDLGGEFMVLDVVPGATTDRFAVSVADGPVESPEELRFALLIVDVDDTGDVVAVRELDDPIHTLEGAMAISPDNRWLAATDGLGPRESRRTVYVWDLTTGRRTGSPDTTGVYDVAWADAETLAVLAVNGVDLLTISGPTDSSGPVDAMHVDADWATLTTWTGANGTISRRPWPFDEAAEQRPGAASTSAFVGEAARPADFASDRSGSIVATMSRNDGLVIDDLSADRRVAIGSFESSDTGSYLAPPVIVAPDGDWILTSYGTLEAGEVALVVMDRSGAELRQLVEAVGLAAGTAGPDGRTIGGYRMPAAMVTGREPGTIVLVDVVTGVVTELGETSAAAAVAISPDGDLMASGHDDGTIRIWDLEARTLVRTIDGHRRDVTGLAFNGDSTELASAAGDLVVWRVADGDRLFDSTDIDALGELEMQHVAMETSGHRLVAGGPGGIVHLAGPDAERACALAPADAVERLVAVTGTTSACSRVAAVAD